MIDSKSDISNKDLEHIVNGYKEQEKFTQCEFSPLPAFTPLPPILGFASVGYSQDSKVHSEE